MRCALFVVRRWSSVLCCVVLSLIALSGVWRCVSVADACCLYVLVLGVRCSLFVVCCVLFVVVWGSLFGVCCFLFDV